MDASNRPGNQGCDGPVGYRREMYHPFWGIPLEVGPTRPREIEEALALVAGQARNWLERAEQDGESSGCPRVLRSLP